MQSTHHHKMTNVKFSVLIEEGSFNILLNNVSLVSSVRMLGLCFQNGVKLVDFVDDSDSVPPI